jgi:hypothetical protein
MQIFELTQPPVNEIDYSKTGGSGGSSAAGNFLRGLGSTVGIKSPEPDPEDPKKMLSQQIRDAEKYFDVAVDLLDRDPPAGESTIVARLTNKYGATKQQALVAIDSAFRYLEKENQDKESDITQPRVDPFDTMAHQLGKRQANPSRVVPPAPTTVPATKTTTASVAPTPPTPAQIRQAKLRAAAAAADAATATGTPLSQMTPAQKREAGWKFGGAMARAAMSNPVAPTAPAAPAVQQPLTAQQQSDVAQGLISLGYTSKQATAMAAKVPPGTPEQDAIKLALAGKLNESLTWSRDFDPSAALLKKMRS